MVISHCAPAQCKFFTSHQSRVTSREIQLYFSRGRKGSGDSPGLQSRRFGPSRVEWWVRLPHASARTSFSQLPNACTSKHNGLVTSPRDPRIILGSLGEVTRPLCLLVQALGSCEKEVLAEA